MQIVDKPRQTLCKPFFVLFAICRILKRKRTRNLGLSGHTIGLYLELSVAIYAYLALFKPIWPYVCLSGTSWPYLALSNVIFAYLAILAPIWPYLDILSVHPRSQFDRNLQGIHT